LISETKIHISSTWINYQKAGSQTDPAILLLHGLGTRASFWLPVIPSLVEQGFQVYALDLPGFGKSDPVDQLFSPETVGELISDFVKNLNLLPVTVIGHSMGGMLAGSLAINDPACIKGLVLVDPYGFSNTLIPVSPAILLNLAIPSLFYRLTGQTDKLIQPIIESNFHVSDRLDPGTLDMAIAENWLGSSIDRAKILCGLGLSLGLRAQRKQFVENLRKRFLEFRFPILVIWGQDDAFLPVRDAYQIKAKIPEIELKIIPDCGHVPPLEQTGQLIRMFIDFIKEISYRISRKSDLTKKNPNG
jgi:pimeloyl-ACP methyl ester carboxylesterase